MSKRRIARMVAWVYPETDRTASNSELTDTLLDAGDDSWLSFGGQAVSLVAAGCAARWRRAEFMPLRLAGGISIVWLLSAVAMTGISGTKGAASWTDAVAWNWYVAPALVLACLAARLKKAAGVIGLAWLVLLLVQDPRLGLGPWLAVFAPALLGFSWLTVAAGGNQRDPSFVARMSVAGGSSVPGAGLSAAGAGLWTATRMHPRRGGPLILLLSVLLALIVVVAAGVAGTAHFTGARWLPHGVRSSHHGQHPSHCNPHAFGQLVSGCSFNLSGSGGSSKVGSFPTELVLLIFAGIVVAMLACLAWVWLRRRRRPRARDLIAVEEQTPPETPEEAESEVERLRTGIERALEALDEDREPADAVIRAWLGVQQTAEESGIVRDPAETPTEFTTRIMRTAFADDHAIRTLLRLYQRTRFGDHPVTSDDVEAARQALRELVGNWQTAVAGAARPEH